MGETRGEVGRDFIGGELIKKGEYLLKTPRVT
jgi:hypothetical protein